MCVVSFDSITYLDSNGASCQSVCGCMHACVRACGCEYVCVFVSVLPCNALRDPDEPSPASFSTQFRF